MTAPSQIRSRALPARDAQPRTSVPSGSRKPTLPSAGLPQWLITVLAGIPLVVVLGIVWNLISNAMDTPFVPTLGTIGRRFFDDWFSGPASQLFLSQKLLDNGGPTVARLLIGWTTGVAIGIIGGVVIARFAALRDMAMPLIRLGMSTPSPALLPVAIAFFGLGTSMKVFFIAFGTIWPVLTNTIAGLANSDQYVLNSGRSLILGKWLYITEVLIPQASPQIMSGIRVGSNAAILLIAVAELYASKSGIGFVIVETQRNFDLVGTWSGIYILCLIGVLFNALFAAFEHRLMRWHYRSRSIS